LADQELVVDSVGQRRLCPHVSEGQQLRCRNCSHLRHPQEELREEEVEEEQLAQEASKKLKLTSADSGNCVRILNLAVSAIWQI